MPHIRSFLVSAALVLAACDSPPATTPPVNDAGTDAGPSDAGSPYPRVCENLLPSHCLAPWPSSFYLADDTSTATGRRIDIPTEAMPLSRRGARASTELFSRFDGFSPATSMVAVFDANVDPANLADERHIPDSLLDASPTVLLEVASDGSTTRVAHFAELDTWPDQDVNRRPLYIRPATRLREGTRYVVAIRSLRVVGGGAVEAPAYFRALRDGTPLADAPDLESRRAAMDEVLGIVTAAGIERSSLQVAWDFWTASGENIWGDAIAMRDSALRAVAADTGSPRCTITMVDEMPATEIFRRVHGTVRVPLYLEGEAPEDPMQGRIRRDASGAPTQNGWAEVPFVLNIPHSVRDGVRDGTLPEGARLLDYGHGLFGSRFESSSGWFRETIRRTRMVSVAIDWWGMSEDDVSRVALTLSSDFSLFPATSERLTQSLVNHVVLVRSMVMAGGCAELPELQIALEAGGTAPAIDTTQSYYYGNSQGGIMGGALAGVAVDTTRFVLGVGGMSYSIMIPRSTNWQVYGSILRTGYLDAVERSILMQASQSQWDLSEPSTFAPHLVRDPLPCGLGETECPGGLTPEKRILMQIGRDDAQVANITAEIEARTIAIPVSLPAPFTPYGLEPRMVAMGEVVGPSALVIYDIPGVPMLPLGTRDPIDDNAAHEGVRRADRAIEQLDLFCRPDGEVVQTCDGVCDPD